MDRVQDITISDSSLITEYVNYFLNGDYNSAFSLLNDSQLDNKKMIATVMNNISSMLLQLENNFQNNVIDYLQSELNIFQNVINNYKFIGDYNSSVVYRIYNYVLYNNKHYMYINNTPSSNKIPTNTNYWVEIDLTGEQGSPSFGLNFRYNWQSNFNYSVYDVVYYNDCLWVAFQDNYNVVPSEESASQTATLIIDEIVESTSNFGGGIITASAIDENGILDTSNLIYSNDAWQVLLKFKRSSIYCNSSSPIDVYNGLIWFEIVE